MNPESIKPSVLMVAAEDSSAHYAHQFLKLLPSQNLPLSQSHFWGIGSKDMQALGFEALATPQEMAVMGLVEVVKHYRRLKGVFNALLKRCDQQRPQLAILMDYPGFNLRLAKELKQRNIYVIYWIPPQVWAWKKNRVHKIKKYVDQVIDVFPFEKTFFDQYQVPNHYFGHPLVDEVQQFDQLPESREMRRQRVGIAADRLVVGLMPGSRPSELASLLSLFLQVAERLYQKNKKVVFVLPVAPSLELADVKMQLEGLSVPLIIQKKDPKLVIDLMDVALVTSGTATLLVGLMQKPMVIVYRFHFLTAFLAKHWVKGISFFGLPNLILNQKVVPEYFQQEIQVDQIVADLWGWLEQPEGRLQVQQKLASLRSVLGGDQVVNKVITFVQASLKPLAPK